jgi:hypothetical protein
MSITLFCLVKGKTTANAFEVDIEKDKPISKLKEAIKAKKAPVFDNFPADELKLWKVPISVDQDDQLWNLSLEDSDELLAIRKILKYFPDSPSEECIHVLVEPPESSQEVKELLDRITSLEEKLSKNEYGT